MIAPHQGNGTISACTKRGYMLIVPSVKEMLFIIYGFGFTMIKKWLTLALKVTVSLTLIWFLLDGIDIAAAKKRLVEILPEMLILACAIFVFQMVFAVLRWQAVLTAIQSPLSFLKALQFAYIGVFFNQTLPSSVGGDAVRIYFTHREGLTLSGAINGIMLERVAGMFALIILVLATQPFFLPRVGDGNAAWILPAISLFAVTAVAGLCFIMILDRLPPSLHRWWLIRGLALLAIDARRVFLNPFHALKALGWATLGYLLLTLGVYVLALGINLNITWTDCIALIPPVILVTILPISIAGWGVREGAMVVAMGLIGVPAEGALVLSLMFGLVAIITSLPGGLAWLCSGKINNRKNIEVTKELRRGK